MSFRGDDQRRYGHVPPVQYPVANQHDQSQYPARRPSFNDGDDSAFFDHSQQPPPPPQRGEDELFLTSPVEPTSATSSRLNYSSSQSAMSGYQHQYQGQAPPTPSHTTYNPQAFARSQSTSLPYHPASRYASPTSPTYPPQQQQQQQQPASYTPQTYNPAAYANTNAPQRTATYSGFNNYAHSYSSPAVPQTTATYGQAANPIYSPSQTQAPSLSAQPSYDPSLTSGQAGTPSTLPATPYDSSYSATYSGGSYFNTYSANGASPSTATPASAHPTAVSQAPYPTYSQIPVGPNYSAADPNAFINRLSRSSSTASSVPSPPTHSSSSPGLQRHPTNAPLPSRPMENVPEESDWSYSGRPAADERMTQDSLIQDIVADLGVTTNPQRPRPINGNVPGDELSRLRHYDSNASTVHSMDDGTGVNRYSSTASTVNRNNTRSTYDWRSDDSDPEGAFGVYEMQQADLENRRFSGDTVIPQSATTTVPTLSPQAEEQQLSDTEFVGMDLGLFSGGYAGNLTYGNDVGSYANELGSPAASGQVYEDERDVRPLPPSRSYGGEAPYPEDDHMDYGGTGGLQAPVLHRLSFDEGEERVSVHSQHSGSESPYKDDYPDMFYHPGLTNRPLPAIPPGSDSSSLLSVQAANRSPYQHGYSLSGDSTYLGYGAQTPQSVERSVSLSSHSNTPQVQLPGRARTDAAEERRKAAKQMTQQQQLAAQAGGAYDAPEAATPNSMTFDMITLPSGRRKKFVPSKLSAGDMRRCTEPWALSGIASWIREMAEGEPDLKRKTIEEGLVKLFTEKVPTMNVADAETLATMVADEMFDAGILIPEEEWVKFGQGSISGVLWQLTGLGCYAPRLHENEMHGRCYSHHCTRTLKKANLDDLLSEESVKKVDWATHYGISKEVVDSKHKKEVERQNVLHEIVTSEEEYTNQLDVLLVLYRNQLRAWQPPIIPPTKLDGFIKSVFGQAEAVHETNKNNLLAQLKYRQNEQGPWLVGFSDIFREWIRKAREPYIKYSQAYPYASYNVRREANKNVLFRQFLDHVRNHKRSDRLGWDTFLKAPITRLQRYTLLLNTVLKNTIQDSEEKVNLGKAIEEIKNVTLECDKLVAEMQRQVSLVELQTMLVFRPGLASTLNLDHLGRELLWQGDLQRMGSKGVRWVDTHALLFDHFFILAKTVVSRDGRNEKKYDVSKEPMPMPLLILESMHDDPVSKQKGLAAPLARTTTAASDTKLNKVASNGADRPGLETAATSSSMTSVTRLGPTTSNEEGKILYPFKVKHLGHDIYTLYAATLQSRQDWVNKIIEAKTRHAKALYTQNAEPFRLRVVADSAFAYDSVSAIGKTPAVSIRGTPLDRAIREMEQVYGPGRGPAPVCRASVNCATAFTAFGKSIIAIGTDYGVYISEASDARGWTRSVQINRVTQITVLEEFSVCLILADKSLISYPLDVVAPVSNYPAPTHDNSRKAPQRLAKDVSFFATARMKDRMLLFYKRKEGLHNTFKVLEPVYQKATEKKSRLFGGRKGGSGNTESFRDYDEFYLPVDCYSINLFQSYIAVSTAKGIEMLTLDKKQTMSVPRDLTMPAAASIAARLREQKPLGMFRLNEQEFLLAHEDCTVYVNKHGEVSRTLIMEYSGKQKKAKAATMFGQYLLLFNEDYVEVRDADNGRLRQIIAGRDVRCLDYGFRGPTGTNVTTASMANGGAAQLPDGVGQESKGTVKICMAHPEVPGAQIVLELLLNEGHLQKGR